MEDPLLSSSVGFADLPEQILKERNPSTRMLKSWFIILGLCLFIGLLSFKPSEPYLTEYLLCNYDTQSSYCSDFSSSDACGGEAPCLWNAQSATCTLLNCADVSLEDCGDDDYNYCYKDGGICKDMRCYQHFTEDEVNNEIYPWSTYAYLPFLVILGPLAELVSYRVSILFGILGRVVTRILLLFGTSLMDMQVMQVTYALGTAAEDVFSAYVYYVVEVEQYQIATSYVKTAALLSALLSGVLGDLLVVFAHTSLTTLMWLSAGFVWAGFVLGLGLLRPSNKASKPLPSPITPRHLHHLAGDIGDEESGERGAASLTSRFVSFFYPSRRSPSSPTSAARESVVIQGEDEGSDDNPVTSTSGLLFSDNPFVHRESMQRGRGVSGDMSHNTKTKFSSSRSLSLYQLRKKHKRALRQKLRLFSYQLRQLCEAVRYPAVLMMLVLWIIGNAVYSILYNYEVSIYQELNGSNTWNGSVLAIMLVFGSVGAMMPTWLHAADVTPCTPSSSSPDARRVGGLYRGPGSDWADSDVIVAVRLLVAAGISSASLLLSIGSWSLYPTIAFLALFFATWQYINVIVYARLASHLKVLQMESQLLKHLSGEEVEKVLKGLDKADSERDSASDLTSFHYSHLIQEEEVTSSERQGPPPPPPPPHRASSPPPPMLFSNSQEGEEMTQQPHHSLSSTTSSATTSVTRSSLPPLATSLPPTTSLYTSSPLIAPSQTQPHPPGGAVSLKQVARRLEADPPYSVAFVTLVALNVVVQIAVQSVVFSWLMLDLRSASTIIVLIFFAVTSLYLVSSLLLFGPRLSAQVCGVTSLCLSLVSIACYVVAVVGSGSGSGIVVVGRW